jgi:hypothetical protein
MLVPTRYLMGNVEQLTLLQGQSLKRNLDRHKPHKIFGLDNGTVDYQ